MNTLTRKQLKEALIKHKYILARYGNGNTIGMSHRILKTKRIVEANKKPELFSAVWGYEPCDFQTYLTHKGVFISKF